MNWTCEQIEHRLSDYLDGFLPPEEQRAFDAHVNSCARCTPLVAEVSRLVGNLRSMEQVESPPRLVYNILDRTLGPRDTAKGWAGVWKWIRGIASPRFAYGALSVAATFMVILTASGFSWKKPKLADLSPIAVFRHANQEAHLIYASGTRFVTSLKVVYEIQSRLRQDEQIPSRQNDSSPEKPGSTDGTRPGSHQQNRANDLASRFQVMASEIPVVSLRFSEWVTGGLIR